jgi:serine/threonine protein kinase/tetratricopeptide (TPR) repeat protein
MTLSPGTKLGTFEILASIGKGGMGEVFRAKDTRLGRDVAIKVLREDLASDPARLKRFEQEARAASALNHPNIITIYEIGKHGKTPYIAMEYVAGKTLSEIGGDAPFSANELVRIAMQIAEGLAKAHAADIIHRDIKPQNIMVTADGYVKILDFGLAKLHRATPESDTDAATLTREGTSPGLLMGTAAYMSPEQALGRGIDARSDLFSLGAVLYEMATGKRPYVGETLAELFDALLHKSPEPPRRLNPDLPEELNRIILKALEKDLSARYASAQVLLDALKGVVTDTAPRSAKRSIVVLPFEDISPDRDNEYFADGLTEEIIADLSKIEALRVISRTSAMRLKGTDKDLSTISRELNTQYVLEGSVRKAGNNLRITAQLIDASDEHLWSEKYKGTLDDVFDIQEEVSRAIVDALELKLAPGDEQRIAERPIDNIQAYECYLKARGEMSRLTVAGIDRSIQQLQHGLGIVGENVLLYMGLADAYFNYYEFGIKVDEATLQKAEEYIDKVLAIQPNSSHSHHLLGMIERFRGSLLKAIRHFEKALAIDPNSTETLAFLSLAYSCEAGRPTSAEFLVKRLLEIDPLTPMNYLMLGVAKWLAGKLDSAISAFEKMAQLEPESILPKVWIPVVFVWKKQHERAFELMDQLTSQEPHDAMHKMFTEIVLCIRHALAGNKTTALKALSEDVKNYLWHDPEFPWFGAGIYSLMNEKDEALRWLEHAINRGWINYPLFNEQDPFYENIRGEKRFKELMERIRPVWENFEVRADLPQ